MSLACNCYTKWYANCYIVLQSWSWVNWFGRRQEKVKDLNPIRLFLKPWFLQWVRKAGGKDESARGNHRAGA